jgi:hypothetical protein
VSPSFRDELNIALSPGKVAMVRLGRGLKTAPVSRQEFVCAAAQPGEAFWASALGCLERALQQHQSGKADATVLLSNHFVRYALVPWSEQISDADEEQAFIRHCFTKTYGAEAQHWALRMSPAGYGETQVACAVDRELLDGLERVSASHGLRLTSLQPYFMAAFNQWRRQLPNSAVWFVVAEPGRLCVSLLERGQWRILRVVKVGDDWRDTLGKLLEREYLVSDSGPERGKVYLHVPDDESEIILPGWTVHRLGANPHAPVPNEFRLAMSMNG